MNICEYDYKYFRFHVHFHSVLHSTFSKRLSSEIIYQLRFYRISIERVIFLWFWLICKQAQSLNCWYNP